MLLIELPHACTEVRLVCGSEATAFAVRGCSLLHRPSDLVDFESGDSDNEILAKYKPSKPQTKIYKQPYA